MSALTSCYGADVEALADAAGPLGEVSSASLEEFVLRQWRDVAATLGFQQPLESLARGLRSAHGGLSSLHSAALAAFEQWHRARSREVSQVSVALRLARARVRHEVLVQYAAARPDRLWVLDEPATSLADGACFTQAPGSTGLSGRAFLEDPGPGYFHGVRPPSSQGACGWQTPVFLSLGTYPWVYGSRLVRTPPGLDWEEAGQWSPAATAMSLCSRLWQPEGNLTQDARAVVFAWRHYKQQTDAALRDVPAYSGRVVAGQLHRRSHFLGVDQASLELETVQAPAGPLNAAAHNYIVRRFAAFFALRRALLSAPHRLTPDQARTLAKNPDPCVRPFVPLRAEARR